MLLLQFTFQLLQLLLLLSFLSRMFAMLCSLLGFGSFPNDLCEADTMLQELQETGFLNCMPTTASAALQLLLLLILQVAVV